MHSSSRLALASLLILALATSPSALRAEQAVGEIPHFAVKDGRHAFIVDGAPYIILGGQCGNSSAWPSELPGVWSAVERMHANTLEAPVYWEQFEAEQGRYDTTIVDLMIKQAREHHVHLVLLWFGTWKNGSAHYLPLWMKAHPDLYPKVTGKTGLPVDTPSPHYPAMEEADARAFSALMRHLKAIDPIHTVLMVQVENESGAWDTIRDYSPTAQAIFEKPVPAQLTQALGLGGKSGGNWTEVFGKDADEYFHAWSVAHFVGQVAAAGKAEYNLPMYTNAALRDPVAPGPAGTYESGGPTDNVLSIWKAAAPALDVLAPDIYQNDNAKYRRVLELYSRPDNPLFVPETIGSPFGAHMLFAALGQGAVGWSPFGINHVFDPESEMAKKQDGDRLSPVGTNFRIVAPIMRQVAQLQYDGKLLAFAEDADVHVQGAEFAGWKVSVSYGVPRGYGKDPIGNPAPIGGAIIGSTGPDEFLVTGHACRVDFRPPASAPKAQREYLRVEEGFYEGSVFVPTRIWNGDETDYGLAFGSTPVALRVRVRAY
jgi:beta-galactosidase GanA